MQEFQSGKEGLVHGEQWGHSIVATMFNAVVGKVHSTGVPCFQETVRVSVLNCSDCWEFKVRGHVSIMCQSHFDPSDQDGKLEKIRVFCCRRKFFSRVKTRLLIKMTRTWSNSKEPLKSSLICFLFLKTKILISKKTRIPGSAVQPHLRNVWPRFDPEQHSICSHLEVFCAVFTDVTPGPYSLPG